MSPDAGKNENLGIVHQVERPASVGSTIVSIFPSVIALSMSSFILFGIICAVDDCRANIKKQVIS